MYKRVVRDYCYGLMRRPFTTAVAVVAAVLALSAPALADDSGGSGQIRWSKSSWATSQPAAAATGDPIHQTLNLEAQYWRCSNQMPPRCWEVGAIKFYSTTDLGYRQHGFNGKSAVVRGALSWREYTGKHFRTSCHLKDKTACGGAMRIPHQRTWGKTPKWYTPTRFPSPDGFFRYVAVGVCARHLFGVGGSQFPDRLFGPSQPVLLRCRLSVGSSAGRPRWSCVTPTATLSTCATTRAGISTSTTTTTKTMSTDGSSDDQ